MLEEGLQLAQVRGSAWGRTCCPCSMPLGPAHASSLRRSAAEPHAVLPAASMHAQETQDLKAERALVRVRARANRECGDPAAALRDLQYSLALSQQLGEAVGDADTWGEMGDLLAGGCGGGRRACHALLLTRCGHAAAAKECVHLLHFLAPSQPPWPAPLVPPACLPTAELGDLATAGRYYDKCIEAIQNEADSTLSSTWDV